jgi:hypothetical protein
MAAIPPGKTWFDTHKTSFSDVAIGPDQGIDTSSFLEAAEATTTLFGLIPLPFLPTLITNNPSDVLGSVAFTPVKSDMTGNITKVRTRYLAHPLLSKSLQGLVRSELSQRQHKATEGLLWLVRGLDFTAQALRQDLIANSGILANDAKPSQELADSFKTSYKQTLAPYHGFLVKPVFNMAMSATPYRRDMYAKIVGEGADPTTAQEQMDKWVTALEERIVILKEFMGSKEAKW